MLTVGYQRDKCLSKLVTTSIHSKLAIILEIIQQYLVITKLYWNLRNSSNNNNYSKRLITQKSFRYILTAKSEHE